MVANSRKQIFPHLSLVKGSLNAPLQVVMLENLNSDQDRLVSAYIKRAQLQGVCVGALIGSEDWDVRPLIIEKGELTITRFTNPSEKFEQSDFASLQALFVRIFILPGIPGVLGYGVSGNQLWFKRKFYQSTMLDSLKSLDKVSVREKKVKAIALIHALEHMHSLGVIHGHISASNIAWEGSVPVFLDYGFAQHELGRNILTFLPPELRMGSAAIPASDVFGLGSVIMELLAKHLNPEEEEIVASMNEERLERRPSLGEVAVCLDHYLEPESPTIELKVDSHTTTGSLTSLTDVAEQDSRSIVDEDGHQISKKRIRRIKISKKISGNQFTWTAAQSNLMLGVLALLIVVSGYLVFTRNQGELAQASSIGEDVSSFKEFWSSGQPSMMQAVARAAIENNDRIAQSVIIKDILAGGKPNQVRSDLLMTVFNPKWENQLSQEDRKTALILGLSGLFDKNLPAMPSLRNAHPMVLLAIAGSLHTETKVSDLDSISVERLSELPAPYDAPFKALLKLKSATLQDVNVRALSHIVLGDKSELMLNKFLGELQENVELFKKLRVLTYVFDQQPGYDSLVYTQLISRSKVFAQAYSWFDEESFAAWDKLTIADKIGIVTGIYPKKELSFEQYADLLRFPNPRIANQAASDLDAHFYKGTMTKILTYMGGEENKLSRYQTMSLLPAFPLTGQAATIFYTKWFNSSPDVDSVVSLLIMRADAGKDDRFNVHAALYLSDKPWKASIDKLRQLVAHPEPLVRALAYARLQKTNPQELQILKNMAFAETNKTLKAAIKSRLNS